MAIGSYHVVEKTFRDYADDIEGVNIHYLVTPLDEVPDWAGQRATRFMPLSADRLRRKSLKLPIVIHCRDAFDQVFEVLQQEQGEDLRGIFHCFTGTIEQARQVIDLGFYLGIGGVVTYKNSGLDKVAEQVDLKHIVLETDSPYLTPVPYRGKPNESSYLIYVAQKVADLHQTDLETVAAITTENSKKVFGV